MRNSIRSGRRTWFYSFFLSFSSDQNPNEQEADTILSSSSTILDRIKVEGLYLVCTTDIVKDSSSRYKQTLRICDILSPENITECELEVPKTWPAYLGIARFKGRGHAKVTETSGETHIFCRLCKIMQLLTSWNHEPLDV